MLVCLCPDFQTDELFVHVLKFFNIEDNVEFRFGGVDTSVVFVIYVLLILCFCVFVKIFKIFAK